MARLDITDNLKLPLASYSIAILNQHDISFLEISSLNMPLRPYNQPKKIIVGPLLPEAVYYTVDEVEFVPVANPFFERTLRYFWRSSPKQQVIWAEVASVIWTSGMFTNSSLVSNLGCFVHHSLQLTEIHDLISNRCVECFLCQFN